jgi:hypothetical protein
MLHNDGGVDRGSTVSGPGYLLPVSELISDRYQSAGSLKALSVWANSLGGPPQGYLVFQAVEKAFARCSSRSRSRFSALAC